MGGGGKGGSQEIVTVTYTYECKSAIVFSWGPIDTFLRLDINDKFHVYNVRRGDTQTWTENNPGDNDFGFLGKWLNINSGTVTEMTHIATDYMVLENGETVKSGRIYWGTDTQGIDPLLDANMGHMGFTPTYRRCAYSAIWWDLGSQPSIPSVSFTFSRYFCACPGLTLHIVDPDGARGINPAHALYDIMTSPYYGFGLDSTIVDADSFVEASSYLFNEGVGIGYSLAYGEVYNGVRAILDWIDGEIIYKNGKVSLRLRREDYIYQQVPVFTEADIKARSFSATRPSWYATKNVVYLNFNDVNREHDQNAVYLEDLANIIMTGTTRVQEFNYDMHTNDKTAQRVCARLLHRQSYPFLIVEFECYARGSELDMFEPFRLKHDYYKIDNIFRVVEKIRQGPNLWKIQALEERFAPDSLYVPQEMEMDHPQYWDPSEIEWDVRFIENPYRGMLALPYALTPITFKAGCTYDWSTVLKPGMEWYAIPPMDKCLYKIDMDEDGSTDWTDETGYASMGWLKGNFNSGDTEFTFTADLHYSADYTKADYVLIHNEFIALDKIEPGDDVRTFKAYVKTDGRAVELSVLDDHPDGARVFNPDCRAIDTTSLKSTIDWRDKNPAFYKVQCIPHYLLPKPHYSSTNAKYKNVEFRNYLCRPLGLGWKTHVYNMPDSWNNTISLHSFFETRTGLTVQPCPPLKPYGTMGAEYCAVEDRDYLHPTATFCGADDSLWQEMSCDYRKGLHIELWLWDGTFEYDGDRYYMNSYVGEPEDPDNIWTSDAYAFDFPLSNWAYTSTPGTSTGYGNLTATGVNCGDLSQAISGVKIRIWATPGEAGCTYGTVKGIPFGGGISRVAEQNMPKWNWGYKGSESDDPLEGPDEDGGWYGEWAEQQNDGTWDYASIRDGMGIHLWMEAATGYTPGMGSLYVGVGRVEVKICNDWIINPQKGITSAGAVYSEDVDYNNGLDKYWTIQSSTLQSLGMTVGFMWRVWSIGSDSTRNGWMSFDAYQWWTGTQWQMLTHMWEDPFYGEADPDQWKILPFGEWWG